jgi:hypothetical protein
LHADHPVHCRTLADSLRARSDGSSPLVRAFRGLGSISPAVLRERCVALATRRAQCIGKDDVLAVVQVFGAA